MPQGRNATKSSTADKLAPRPPAGGSPLSCQVLRGFPKEIVFAQTLFCFELATVDLTLRGD
jgi:hypothetical protein